MNIAPALKPLFKCSEKHRRLVKKSWGEAVFNSLDKERFGDDKTHSVEEERLTNLSGHAGVFGVI